MERKCQEGFSPSTFLAPSQRCQLWAGDAEGAEPLQQGSFEIKPVCLALVSHGKSGSQQEQSPGKPPPLQTQGPGVSSVAPTSSSLRLILGSPEQAERGGRENPQEGPSRWG